MQRSFEGDPRSRRVPEEGLQPPVEHLRAVEPRDLKTMLRWFQDSSILPHLIGLTIDTTVKDLDQYYRKPRVHGLVAERPDGTIVSTVAFKDADAADPDTFMRMRSAEMVRGCVDPLRQGKHVGTRTFAQALDEHAFNPDGLNYDKVAAGYIKVPGYEAVKHVLDTLGFRVIGSRFREVEKTIDGKTDHFDVVLVELSREQWLARKDRVFARLNEPPRRPFIPFSRLG